MAHQREPRTFTTCPTCRARVRKDRLGRHRRKVHDEITPPPKRGRDGMTALERPVVYGVFVDETTDVSDRCAAITKAGTRCTRPIAVPIGGSGYCNQHY
jgi:hypothetical protein